MSTDNLQQIESFVHDVMTVPGSELAIAHDFNHVDRVRRWAVVIARCEGLGDL